jgi:hydrogenase nickel incorporation protein HypB
VTRRIEIVESLVADNDRLAASNRRLLDEAGVFAVNLMASPGAGKTSLIERTVRSLAGSQHVAVIDGDLATALDADRAEAAGAEAVQINTGGQCHLDAHMVAKGFDLLDLRGCDLLLIENVGNLVCTASFALGTHLDVLVASVPEGDDKPYKYPASYRHIDALILNKIDLLPHVAFDLERFRHGVEVLNPGVPFFPVSCATGEGIEAWTAWVLERSSRSAARMEAES